MTSHDQELEERILHRLLFFTDAVFAIVLTLLVLELKPPGGLDLARLADLGEPLFAFALSFAIVAAYWVANMGNMRRLIRFDWATLIANLACLFPICLIPLASAWLGRGVAAPGPWVAYYGVTLGCSITEVVSLVVATRGGGRLIAGGITPRARLYWLGRAASPGFAFLIGIAAAAAGVVQVSWFAWAFIPVFLLACELLLKPRAQPVPAARAKARRKA